MKAIQGEIQFEAWTKGRPDVKSSEDLGCLCYSHVAKDERHKFDTKVRKCIMLGYGTETETY